MRIREIRAYNSLIHFTNFSDAKNIIIFMIYSRDLFVILYSGVLFIMRRFILFSFTLFLFLSSCTSSYSKINIDGLTLEECITLALNNHPSLRSAKSSTRDLYAQLESIRAANRVTVNLTGSLTHSGTYEHFDDRNNATSLRLEASKTLYDTGRNRLQQEMAKESIEGSLESERNTKIQVAANAKRAYYALVLRFLNRDVEREKLRNSEEQLKNAQGLYEVGNSPFVDVTKAQADVSSAKVSLMKAENDILVYQEALRVAMGTDINGPFNIALSTELILPQTVDDDVNVLISRALEDRPDYRKLQHDHRSNELDIRNAARASSPKITGSAGTSLSNSEKGNASETYNFVVNMNVPVVDGGTMKASLESKRAALERTEAAIETLRQSLTYDIRKAVLELTNAIDMVKSSEISVKYAEESLELERGRYEVGIGDPLSVSDAVSKLASARYVYYQALHDAQKARTDLDEALGHFPPEANHD